MRHLSLPLSLTALLVFISCSGKPMQRGNYFGQTPPDSGIALFAPGLVNTAMNERDMTVSADGNWMIYTVLNGNHGVLVGLHRAENGAWSGPEVLSFSGRYSDMEPAFSPLDGALFFASRRPRGETNSRQDYDLWRTVWNGSSWEEPENLGEAVNSEANEFYPGITNNGTVWFTSGREGSLGREDLFYCTWDGNAYSEAIHPGAPLNSPADEFNACITPDGMMILYGTTSQGAGVGGGDIYVSRLQEDGNWSTPELLPVPVNSPRLDYSPSITPDGQILFFTSTRSISASETERLDYATLLKRYQSPGNGNGDIYWGRMSQLIGAE